MAAVTGAGGEVLTADLGQIAADRHDPRTAVCLLEVASLAPPNRAAQLADPAYLDRLADAVAGAIRTLSPERRFRCRAVAGGDAGPLGLRPRGQHLRPGRRPQLPADDHRRRGHDVGQLRQPAAHLVDRRPERRVSSFPHSAICQLDLVGADGNTYWGTGFYIADEVLLSCGHNFLESDGYRCVRVDGQTGLQPDGLDPADQDLRRRRQHPGAPQVGDQLGRGLRPVRAPGPRASGHRRRVQLANMSLAQDMPIVVSGYGKVDGSRSTSRPSAPTATSSAVRPSTCCATR